ncbi:MAG: ArnT family glycosyltransferase [Planctomycetota bacterium]
MGLLRMASIPRVYVDEAWDSALGYNLATEGKLCHPFIDGFGGMNVQFVQNRLVLPFFCAGMFQFVDCTIWTSRFCSQIFAIFAVVGLYKAIYHWYSRKLAFFVVLAVIIHPWFFEVSRRVRPEIYYTAFAMIYFLFLILYFQSGSSLAAFLSGIIAGFSVLTHPAGILIILSISLAFAIWMRIRSIRKLVLLAGAGLLITILPYLIYVFWAVQNPEVNFWEQMQAGELHKWSVFWELGRWKRFFIHSQILPLAPVMIISWITAWYRSSRKDKVLATITLAFPLLLALVSVNRDERYLVAIVPFWSALIIRLISRIMTNEEFVCRKRPKIRFVACASIAVIYILTSLISISVIFFRLYDADFDRVINRIDSVVEPNSRVYGNPVFWFGDKRYTYGSYLISYKGISRRDAIQTVRSYKPNYAIRTVWQIGPPLGIDQVPAHMPEFREGWIIDIVCKTSGRKIYEFNDPYYGPIEIYELK